MAGLGDLIVRVGANIDGFEKAMGTVSQRLNAVDREANKAFSGFDKIGDRLTNVGTTLTAAITLPIAGIGAAAVVAAGDFERSMNRVSALGEITGADLDKLRQQALKLGADTQFSAGQAADGMGELAAAGFSASQILQAMPAVLSLAAAGELEIANAARIASVTVSQFGLDVGQLQHVADGLAKVAADSQASVASLGLALEYVGPIAKTAGFSFDQVAAALGVLSKGGLEAEKAGTGLRGVIGSLADPSKEAAKVLNELGIKVKDVHGNMLPLDQIFGQFAAKNVQVGQTMQVFGRESSSAAAVLTRFVPEMRAFTTSIGDADGAADKMAKTINAGFRGAMEQFKGSVETAGIALGSALLPLVNRALTAFTEFINKAILPAIEWFSKLPEPVQNVALGIAAVAAAMGPALIVGGQLISALATMGTAFTALRGTMGVAIEGATGLTAAKGGLASMLTAVATPAAIAFGIAIAGIQFKHVADEAGALIEALTYTREKTEAAKDSAQSFGDTLRDVVSPALNRISTEYAPALKRGLDELQFRVAKFDWKNLIGPLGALAGSLDVATEWVSKFTGVFPSMDKALVDNQKKLQASVTAHDKLSTAQLQALAGAKGLKEKVSDGNKALGEYAKGAKQADDAVTGLDRKQKTAKKTTEDLGEENIQLANAITDVSAAFLKQDIATAKQSISLKNLTRESEVLIGIYDETISRITNATRASEGLAFAQDTLKDAINRHEQAWKTLGITSTASMEKQAADFKAAYDHIASQADVTLREIQEAWVKSEQAQIALTRQKGQAVDEEYARMIDSLDAELNRGTNSTKQHVEQQATLWGSLGNQVSTIFTDLGRGIADAIVHGKSLGDVFKNVFDEMKEAGLRFVIEFLEQKLFKALGGLLDDILPAIGKKFGEIFGIGDAVGSVAGGAAEAAGGVAGQAGGAAGAAGAAGQAAGAGIQGLIGLGAQIAGAIGSIGSFIQGIRQEGTLNAVEKEVRESKIHLGVLLEKANSYLPYLETIHEFNWTAQLPMLGSINDYVFQILGQINNRIIPALENPERRSVPTTFIFELDGQAFARAVVEDITDLQGQELRIAGAII